MEFLSVFLPIVLYILAAILLVILIIMSLKIIKLLDKVEVITNDVEKKIQSLNSVFRVIDGFTDKISLISDKTISTINGMVSKVLRRKRKDDFDE